jgi:hypothetical protein
MSVAFHAPVRKTINGVSHIVKAELLSTDFVSVPSNRDARVVSVRGLGGQSDVAARAREIAAEAERFLAEWDAREHQRSLAGAYRALANGTALLAYLSSKP